MHESAPALKEYETSLQAARNRYRSFYGAAKAAEQLGDREMAKSNYQKLLTLCTHADTERPELAEAKKYLAPER
jgi:Tfp pilus assembly protein PilF